MKKDRFIHVEMKVLIDTDIFPPETFTYETMIMTLLGKSNKSDLIPINITDNDLIKAIMHGGMVQFIYTSNSGDLYDICLYKCQDSKVYMYGIRSRQKPDKKKRKGDDDE